MLTWRESIKNAGTDNVIDVEVTPVLKDDIHDLMENNFKVASPFMKLFWKEQKK